MMMKGLFNPDDKLSLIPNWISASRAVCGLIIPILILNGVSSQILFGVITYAALSDFLDGRTARLIAKKETFEGSMIDAISDKVFAILLMTFLVPHVHTIAINLALEIVISIINGKVLANGKIPKSNLIGKIKTWPLFTSIGLSYLGLSLNNLGIDVKVIMTIASISSIISVPLEIMSAKKYSETYKNIDIPQNIDKNQNKIQESKIEKGSKKEKNIRLALDKNKNIQVAVYERKTNPNDEKLEKGKQKKIEF